VTESESATPLVCPICAQRQTVGTVPAGARVHCVRCDHLLFQDREGEGGQRVFCFTLTALLLYIPAYFYPILEVTNLGTTRSFTVLSGTRALWEGSMWPLGIAVGLASVALPLCLIIALLLLSITEGPGPLVAVRHSLRRVIEFLSTWAIVDIYLLAIFVTVVKLAQITDAAPTGAALVFFGVVLALNLALRSLETGPDKLPYPDPPAPEKLSRTLALALSALILFVPANVYPTLTLTIVGSSQSDTVFGGVVALWQSGMWPLALLVMCASIVIPLFKIAGMLFLVLTVRMRGRRLERTRLYLLIEKIGRLSMLDVYVISLIVAVMQLGALANGHADVGALAFAAVVIVTMMAARSFDPRLIWIDERDATQGD